MIHNPSVPKGSLDQVAYFVEDVLQALRAVAEQFDQAVSGGKTRDTARNGVCCRSVACGGRGAGADLARLGLQVVADGGKARAIDIEVYQHQIGQMRVGAKKPNPSMSVEVGR